MSDNRNNEPPQETPPPDDSKPPRPPFPRAPKPGKSLMTWVVIIGGCLLIAMLVSEHLDGQREIDMGEFWTYVDNGQLTGTILIKPDQISGELKEDAAGLKEDESRKFYVNFRYDTDENFADKLLARIDKAPGERVKTQFEPLSWWGSILPQLLLMVGVFLIIWFVLLRRMGGGGGGGGILGSFGRSKHRLMSRDDSQVTFNDVAGIQEAKDEVGEIVEFLRNPKKFSRLGGRVPRGVLLIGEPGCGKTMLAKAIAGEADVPFFSISGSDFVEMFVGVGASRVRDLFKQAKDTSPCIIFLDEIDAVGRKRGVGFNGGGHDEREQTLNAILVEMDGFDSNDQVIVVAATNRADVLDPALTRPGRFDRQVQVPLPDLQGRCEILKIYIDKVASGPDVDLHRLARGTPMFSGADLAALVNEAAIAAAMAEKDSVDQSDLEEARDKVRWGRSRKSRAVDTQEQEITAFHEAGHSLVALLTPLTDPLHKVSIIPRGQAGGATYSLPEKDRFLHTRNFCNEELMMLFGGRVAEEIVFGDISSGASSDIMRATRLAKTMVLDWGMSEKLGAINFGAMSDQTGPFDMGDRHYSEKTAEIVDGEIKGLIDNAYNATRKMLNENRHKLDAIAHALQKYETLDADDVQRLADGERLEKPTVDDLLAVEKNKAEQQANKPDPFADLRPLKETD